MADPPPVSAAPPPEPTVTLADAAVLPPTPFTEPEPIQAPAAAVIVAAASWWLDLLLRSRLLEPIPRLSAKAGLEVRDVRGLL